VSNEESEEGAKSAIVEPLVRAGYYQAAIADNDVTN